jgi:predicted ester cyclase
MTTGASLGARVGFALALTLGMFASGAPPSVANEVQDANAVRDLQQRYIDGLNGGDVAAVLATFADSGRYQGSGPSCEQTACVGGAAIGDEIQRQIGAHAHYSTGAGEFIGSALVVPFQVSADDIRFFGAERIVGTLTFEANGDRLSRVGLALDPEDQQTARFHASVQAMAARFAAGQGIMSTEQNKATSQRLYDELFNKGNDAVVEDVLAADFVLHPASAPPITGRAAMTRFASLTRIAFPNQILVLEDQIAERDRVVSRWTIRGTNTGEFDLPGTGSFGASNREMRVSEVRIDRFEGPKIVESWEMLDQLGMLRQLGFAEDPVSRVPATR